MDCEAHTYRRNIAHHAIKRASHSIHQDETQGDAKQTEKEARMRNWTVQGEKIK